MAKRKTKKASTPKTFDSYILFNPAYPPQAVFALLGDKTTEQLVIKGNPEDFADNPREVFKTINERMEVKNVPT